MAIKKSELYSSIWAACDALRGGMDASQYKDYVLVLLFVRYVSDKYKDGKGNVEIPKGGSFDDLKILKGKDNIGEEINKVLSKLAETNELKGVLDVVDFNNDEVLGKGKEMVDRLTKLIDIFSDPKLDFSQNKVGGDDLLGDAYEYLMKNFAVESGKSKGQFYTPAEVSRIMAKILEVDKVETKSPTAYDPTCGSGSLLLKIADESTKNISLWGQERDNVTAGLAKLNMWIHNQETAEIEKGQSTLSNPLFLDNKGCLKPFDFVVANPPFSLKNWASGFVPANDIHERFAGFGIPPEKNGDYAFLLHILKSLKSTGRGAVILPHGVLFRGNSEAEIRKSLVKRGLIKGIIGLPANLFYGTGIPACIILLDKRGATDRKGIFMIDAKNGFIKDGNKNRLREQDIRKICDVWFAHKDIPHFAKFVNQKEIEKNEYNLNIPRYIETENNEIIQDIEAHLSGGIPNVDVEKLENYWQPAPSLKSALFAPLKKNYSKLNVEVEKIRTLIADNREVKKFQAEIFDKERKLFTKFKSILENLSNGDKSKETVKKLSDSLLEKYANLKLVDRYDLYQNLMTYWNETMQDDVAVIIEDGWKAGKQIVRIQKDGKKGRVDVKGLGGLEGVLIPVEIVISEFFAKEKNNLDTLKQNLETTQQAMETLEEEQIGDDGLLLEVLNDKNKVNKKALVKRIKEIEKDANFADELDVLQQFENLVKQEKNLKTQIKDAETKLEVLVLKKYPTFTETIIKDLVLNKKWFATLSKKTAEVQTQLIASLNNEIKILAERYESTLPEIKAEVASLEKEVEKHLKAMGFESKVKK